MTDQIREQVRQRYAAAATAVTTTGRDALAVVDAAQCCPPATTDAVDSCCASDAEVGPAFGSALYSADEQGELPAEAVAASLGCGNPTAVADLRIGEKVLDLGSGGGIDVLLSAKRVGATGFAYGVDMTDEMLGLANANKAKAGAENVEFLKGTIEDVPLSDGVVDVVISNCVINLSTDKPAVLAEMFRVLTPGGRIGISDVVAEDHLTPQMRAERGSYIGCIAGAMSKSEYLEGLAAAGFIDAEVVFTHEAAPGMHGAIVRAVKPAACCAAADQSACCAPSAKADCCNGEHPAGRCACNDAVRQFLQLSGSAGLPLVLVDGVTVLTGSYPDRAQLARWAGLDSSVAAVPAGVTMLALADAGGCCSSDPADGVGCC